MNEQCCVDRLEHETAVLQRPDESCFEIPKKQLPQAVQEGDVLVWRDGSWHLDTAATQQRREKLQELLRRLGQR